MDYSFRISFDRSPTDTIQTEANELVLPTKCTNSLIALRSRQSNLRILDSNQLTVVGSGFNSLQEAEAEGLKVKRALTIALARVRVGADFGDRAANGAFTEHGLKFLEQRISQRVLNNVHGLMVFETLPEPIFASANARMTRRTTPESFLSAYAKSLENSPAISQREELSFTLFNASFFQQTAESRFLLLMMAIEALIERKLRADECRAHVDSLIHQTKGSNLPSHEKESMLGTLKSLCSESITQAGKRIVTERVGSRTYNEKSADAYFTYCYKMRSNLVHGNPQMPSCEEIGGMAATLEVFVSDLLTVPVLGIPQ